MALFKILKGQSINLPEELNEGHCYVTTDTHKLYIDTGSTLAERFALNADQADSALCLSTDAGSDKMPVYFNNGIPVECDKEKLTNNLIDMEYIVNTVIESLPHEGPKYTTVAADDYGDMVWKLTEPYTSQGNGALNTGWAPYDEEKNWTIALKFADNISNVGTDLVSSIFESKDDTARTTLFLRKQFKTDEEQWCYLLGLGLGVGFWIKKENGFFEWVGGDFSDDGYHYLVISNSGGNYIIAFDGGIWNGYGASIGESFSSQSLALFGRQMPDGTYSQYAKGQIKDFRIYDSNLSYSQVTSLIQDMKNSII